MKEEVYELLDVETVDFDTENPRIKKSLEKYGDNINAERIYFALSSTTSVTSSFSQLKDSIRAKGGITSPITVNKKNGKKVCIDGNTRLAIYKDFLKEKTAGNWTKIKALVKENMTQREIEEIRVSAHLVGARDWPAYEKARYLHSLYHSELMNYEEMVALCGGKRKEIEQQIDAYKDMNTYYRDIVDDDSAFHIDRFSGFVELQKPKVKQAIFDAGFELTDFGKWIKDGNIYGLKDVCELPKVLRDNEAKEVFINGGVNSLEEAIQIVKTKDYQQKGKNIENSKLKDSNIYQIAEFLSESINELPFREIQALRDKEQEESLEHIEILDELMGRLKELLENVSE